MLGEMIRETWAIQSAPASNAFLGIYLFDRLVQQPEAQSGFTIATFRNRKIAEQALAELNAAELVPFPSALVTRIKVIVTIL